MEWDCLRQCLPLFACLPGYPLSDRGVGLPSSVSPVVWLHRGCHLLASVIVELHSTTILIVDCDLSSYFMTVIIRQCLRLCSSIATIIVSACDCQVASRPLSSVLAIAQLLHDHSRQCLRLPNCFTNIFVSGSDCLVVSRL